MTILEQVDIILSSTPIDSWSSSEISELIGCAQGKVSEAVNRLPYQVSKARVGRTVWYRKIL